MGKHQKNKTSWPPVGKIAYTEMTKEEQLLFLMRQANIVKKAITFENELILTKDEYCVKEHNRA